MPPPNPPLACPKPPLLPGAVGACAPKPLPNPPPEFDVEAKLNPDADPNPEEAAGLLEVGAAKENPAAEGAEEDAEVLPNPEGGCVGADKVFPKTGAAAEPNPGSDDAKLKELA